jgi:bifunctional DNA-binding transcriptional regulator/antitoxin component of YhaV-PrlF toxin-antitoxin module
MTTSPPPRHLPRPAGRAGSRAARTRAENHNLVRLLRQMPGTPAPAAAQGRVELPARVVGWLGLAPGDLLEFVVTAGVLAFCPVRLRSWNRGTLRADRSVRLPTAVLDVAASGPLVFAPLGDGPGGGAYRLCLQQQAHEPAAVTPASGPPRFPAAVSAAGRLLMPPAVIAGLGVEPGDLIVFGQRDDGSFEVLSLVLVVERAATALRDLVAGHGAAEERRERRLAESRERAVGDPLAGTWRPA